MRKYLFFGLVFLSLALLLSGCSVKPSKNGAEEPRRTPLTPTEPAAVVRELVKDRPYVSLVPSADGHWVTLEVTNLSSTATGLEYEVIYFADIEGSKIERGVSSGGKPVELKGETTFAKKLLFGSASCTTGTCRYKYDEGVSEGALNLKLITAEGVEKYAAVFRIQKGQEAKEGFTTGDGQFRLISANLPASKYYLTTSSVGLPKGTELQAVGVPYAVYPSLSGGGQASVKSEQEGLSLYAYNGRQWQQLATDYANGFYQASYSNQFLFVLAE